MGVVNSYWNIYVNIHKCVYESTFTSNEFGMERSDASEIIIANKDQVVDFVLNNLKNFVMLMVQKSSSEC
jgi:hypothetical protein